MPDYSGVYPFIRTRLQDSILDVDNSDFDVEIAAVLRRLLIPYSLTYATVPADDLPLVDEAAGLMVAARLVSSYATGGAGSDLTSEKTETTSRTFEGSEKETWVADAYEILAFTSFGLANAPSGRFFAAAGNRGNRCDGPSISEIVHDPDAGCVG